MARVSVCESDGGDRAVEAGRKKERAEAECFRFSPLVILWEFDVVGFLLPLGWPAPDPLPAQGTTAPGEDDEMKRKG